MKAVEWSAVILQLGYGLMLVCVGLAGIFTARLELGTVFGMSNLKDLPEQGATFLSQYRFLKSLELGAGLYCLVWRKSILNGRPPLILFLVIVGGGIIARIAAWVSDGQPGWPFLIFLALEALTFCAVVLQVSLRHVRT